MPSIWGSRSRVRLVDDLDRHGKYLEDALGRHSRSLELSILLAQVSNRVEETIDVENERYQDSNLQLTLRDHPAAEDDDQPNGHRGNYLDQWQHQRRDSTRRQVGITVVGI